MHDGQHRYEQVPFHFILYNFMHDGQHRYEQVPFHFILYNSIDDNLPRLTASDVG